MKTLLKLGIIFMSVLVGIVGFIIAPVIFGGCDEDTNKFAEFEVRDLTKPVVFRDKLTGYRKCTGTSAVNIDMVVEGELDGWATVTFSQSASGTITSASMHYKLDKGVIHINKRFDYYSKDIWIKFNPEGCHKGYLKIKTRINEA